MYEGYERRKRLIKIVLGILVLAIIIGPPIYRHFSTSLLVRKVEEKVRVAKPVEYEYEVTSIVNEFYDDFLHWALIDAKKSIYVVMFIAKPVKLGAGIRHPVNLLLNDLMDAAGRGVKVHMILDNPGYEGDWQYEVNKGVVDYLKSAGVDAKLDSSRFKTHDKLVIIDDEVIFIGNHNWTPSAFKHNNEVSVMIKSSPPNLEFRNYYYEIERQIAEEEKRTKEKAKKESK